MAARRLRHASVSSVPGTAEGSRSPASLVSSNFCSSRANFCAGSNSFFFKSCLNLSPTCRYMSASSCTAASRTAALGSAASAAMLGTAARSCSSTAPCVCSRVCMQRSASSRACGALWESAGVRRASSARGGTARLSPSAATHARAACLTHSFVSASLSIICGKTVGTKCEKSWPSRSVNTVNTSSPFWATLKFPPLSQAIRASMSWAARSLVISGSRRTRATSCSPSC